VILIDSITPSGTPRHFLSPFDGWEMESRRKGRYSSSLLEARSCISWNSRPATLLECIRASDAGDYPQIAKNLGQWYAS
jgi:hypothetical protein